MPLACVQWNMTNPGPQSSWTGDQDIKIYRLGHFWWMYGEYAGELQQIRFPKQNFFAPDDKVTAFRYAMVPGVEGFFHPVYTKLDAFDPKILGQAINLAAGRLKGLQQIGREGYIEGTAPEPKKIGTNKRRIGKTE